MVFYTAIILFAITYCLLLIFPKIRAYIALASAVLFVVFRILPLNQIIPAVQWNVILMIGGTMGIVSLFIASKMPSLLADLIIKKMPNVKLAIIALSLFAGLISAFVDNVATVLMVAPVAINICKKLKISPVLSIISIAISSNLQGAATLVGDTTSIMLGQAANMTFADFFVYKGHVGLFFIIQISAIAATAVLLFMLRKYNEKISIEDKTEVKDYFPTYLLLGMVVFLIIASFVPAKYHANILGQDLTNGIICVGLFLIGLIWAIIKKRDFSVVKSAIKEIDYITLLLLVGLFVIIAGIGEAGVIKAMSNVFVKISNNNVFLIYTIIVWASVLISAFVDNIPYVATMLPVVSGIAVAMGIDPVILYFGLLSGATLGGNLTPIGASANIAGLGILRKEGYEVKVGEFMKVSVPFTLTAVAVGYVLIWLIYGI